MAKREYTVSCWVPDPASSGSYRPLKSLPPDELAEFRERTTRRAEEALKAYWNVHPEAWEAL